MTPPPPGLLAAEPLARHTAIGIGGPARHFLRAPDEDTLRQGLAWAAAEGMPVLILGGGSNLLVADAGFPGLVIKIGLRGLSQRGALVRAAAGEDWDEFVAWTIARGLGGLECLSGIPGAVGGGPIQNVGAYGQEVRDTLTRVEALDRATGEAVSFTNADCRFDYRTSRFKHGPDRDRFVITAVTFRLEPGGAPAVRYPDLARRLAEQGIARPTLAEVREAVLAIRRAKAMVWEPDREPNSRSCGSFFTNPVVPREQADDALRRLRAAGAVRPGEEMPQFEAGEGRVKLSAAWLMERSGLRRGLAWGRAGLSERHVLALVNRGGASAAEVVALMRHVQQTVLAATGIALEPEPVLVGF